MDLRVFARAKHPHWDDYEPLIQRMILEKLAAELLSPTDGADSGSPKVRHPQSPKVRRPE